MSGFDPKRAFLESFAEELAERPDAKWVASGKTTKANPDGEDAAWWRTEGPQMVQRWIDWRKNTPWELWVTPDGEPAVELGIDLAIGGVQIRCHIDTVFATKPDAKGLIVVDVKSGARPPDDRLQLGLYKVLIEARYPGISVAGGAYWLARKGGIDGITSLSQYTPQYIAALAQRVRVARAAGVYVPNTGPHCRTCKVAKYCAANGGAQSHLDPDEKLMR